MSFTQVLKNYQGFTLRLAEKLGARADGWLSRRHIRTETSNFVLGADAIPAPVHSLGRRS